MYVSSIVVVNLQDFGLQVREWISNEKQVPNINLHEDVA